MGYDMKFYCTKCGAMREIFLNDGYNFPQRYQWAVETILAGKCGQEWKELYENTPNATVNIDKQLHLCDTCGHFQARQSMSIYVPIDPTVTSRVHNQPYSQDFPAIGWEYATPVEIYHQYRLVKEYVHKCPECKSPMHKYKWEVLKCPKCGEIAMTWNGIPTWC